jgi:hypothetical protein
MTISLGAVLLQHAQFRKHFLSAYARLHDLSHLKWMLDVLHLQLHVYLQQQTPVKSSPPLLDRACAPTTPWLLHGRCSLTFWSSQRRTLNQAYHKPSVKVVIGIASTKKIQILESTTAEPFALQSNSGIANIEETAVEGR